MVRTSGIAAMREGLNGNCAQRAGLDIADRRWQRVEGEHHMAAHEIIG